MGLNIRNYGFFIILLFFLMHGLNIILIEFHSAKVDMLLYRCVPASVFMAIDFLSVLSIGVLLYGLFTFSQTFVLGWFIYVAISWHFPFALIIVNGVMVRHMKITTPHYFMGTLVPALQLCVWSLIMIYVFRYYCVLRQFERLPAFLRSDVSLLQQSHHRYETDKLRKTILTKRSVITY